MRRDGEKSLRSNVKRQGVGTACAGVMWCEMAGAWEAGGARTLRAEGFRVKRDASGFPPGGGWPWRGSQPEGAVVDLAFLRVLMWIGPI